MPIEKRLKAFLNDYEISQNEFAIAAGISPESFYQKMQGRVRFTQDDLAKMSKIMKLSAEEICNMFELEYQKRGD